jgi:hypothetical protein
MRCSRSFATSSGIPTAQPRAFPGTTVGGNYQGTSSSVQRNDQGDIRLDYTLNSKDTFMGKFSYGDAWDTPTRFLSQR